LRFQPTKRPQLSTQKLKTKPGLPKAPLATVNAGLAGPGAAPASGAGTVRAPAKTTLADWTATADDDDVNGFYGGEKRQRGGRKKRKKNRGAETVVQNWDDIYDPSRPNNYDEYRHSEEKIREVREWKDRLYTHRMARKNSSDLDSDDGYSVAPMNSIFCRLLSILRLSSC
jgi:splicing factor 45